MGPKNVGSEEMSITSDASTVQVDNNDSRIHGNKVGINTVIEKPVVPKKQQQQQQHRFGSNDVIPNFAKNGTALTQEERAAIAKRKGLCVQCGVKTHTISVFKKAPLTNDHVYKGLCIKCNPTELPAMVVQAWERRNPRISAPVAPTRTRRAHHQRFSQANVVKPKNRLEAYTTTDDRDIIPIRDIWKESLTIAPTIEDAQDLWLSSLDREIWEPERPPTTSTKTTTGIPTASHPTVNGPATEQPLLDTASATKKPVIPEQIIRGIRDDTASSVASTIDEDGDMEVLSLGTLINDSLLDDDDNKSVVGVCVPTAENLPCSNLAKLSGSAKRPPKRCRLLILNHVFIPWSDTTIHRTKGKCDREGGHCGGLRSVVWQRRKRSKNLAATVLRQLNLCKNSIASFRLRLSSGTKQPADEKKKIGMIYLMIYRYLVKDVAVVVAILFVSSGYDCFISNVISFRCHLVI
ncbi:expressed unknown protein [Seminavis robusta]|uniref:Uncharacterized protein n=1 Tax=Seminavis robusta TaxID=568900 RepID=A0A9N8HWI5_9STRA|nr:expressed unknown protein [Seminavis robusta]|eukprot:Sro1655_g288940.1 n/a (464) ;mRNA; f:5472-7630